MGGAPVPTPVRSDLRSLARWAPMYGMNGMNGTYGESSTGA